MSNYTVYHTDIATSTFGDYPIERDVLAQIGAELRLIEPNKTADELCGLLHDADAIIVSKAPITAAVLDSMPNCKVVVRYGVGLDTLDLDAAAERGIICAHVPDFCAEEVSNHALMLMLAVVKKTVVLDRWVREGLWRPQPLSPMQHLHGQTLGLIACGNIARAFARKAQALGMQVLAYDPYADLAQLDALGIKLVTELDELLAQSDIVSVHAPLTAETHHLINAQALAKMQDSAYLLNTARGPVVDEVALIDALQTGQIAGAGLDVFEREPLPADSPLTSMDNVVLTPHSASYSDYAFRLLSRRVAESVVDVLQGHWPRFVANPAVRTQLQLKPVRSTN
jgi:D-3-phosphoglycerate dehydrogenase